MKVDIEDVLFWMDAIRNSDDRYRTLESFWKGQVHSKIWLIKTLEQFAKTKPNRIVIHGGWNGVLAALLFNSDIVIEHITSVDIDPACEETANTINKRYEIEGRFTAVTSDMKDYKYTKMPDIVINTSTEHVLDDVLQQWQNHIAKGVLVVAQSNDFFELEEHVNCISKSNQLANKIKLEEPSTYYYTTKKYTRFMLIGLK